VSHLPASEQIVASIADRGAGPSYSVTALAAALARQGAPVRLHSVSGWRTNGGAGDASVAHLAHAQDFGRTPFLSAACLSRDLEATLRGSGAEILHSHGLWLAANFYPARASRQGSAKLVTSPRGMLSPAAMAFSPARKWLAWRLFQRRALADSALIHATSEAELSDVRGAGLTNPVAVIANGVGLPPPAAARSGPLTVLSLGRIHPKKGLESLVQAWAAVETARPDWRLRIVGPAELGHDEDLKALGDRLGLRRLTIEAPCYGEARLEALRGADIFVLPTTGENFAMTVAEALAAGTPVISTRGAPWSGLATQGCGWWIDHGSEPLAAALEQAMSLGRPALQVMGERGRTWMARDFSWDRIAEEMLAAYIWVTRGGQRPESVRLD
jgi:glycosyltransferase involved in cell wall biosynthesis